MLPQVIVKHAPKSSERIRVAVLPFKDAPGAPGSGEAAAEALTIHLLKIPQYEMIERSALEQILKEQNLSLTGAIDPQTAAKLGNLIGTDALVIGSVAQFQKRRFQILPPAKVTISARMVRTDTGTIDWTATYTLGWHPVKWALCFFWPLAVIFIITSPTAEDRINKAAKGMMNELAKLSRIKVHQ